MKFPKHFLDKYDIGALLGYGADGEVYQLNNKDRVLKISQSKKTEFEIRSLFDSIVNKDLVSYAKVYNFEYLGSFYKDMKYFGIQCVYDYKVHFNAYSYEMEKLIELSKQEKQTLKYILHTQDSYKNKLKMINNMNIAFKENAIEFLNNYDKVSFNHNDLYMNIRNIMKDKNNNFKIIDFDRAELK